MEGRRLELVANTGSGTVGSGDAGRDAARWSPPPGSKLLVVSPHPDDETLAAAGLMQAVLRERGSVRVVFVTNGDGYAEAVAARTDGQKPTATDFRRYGRQRQSEAMDAQLELGIPPSWLKFLGFPDGGIEALWGPYWCSAEPYVSPFTEQRRALAEDGREYRGAELKQQLVDFLRAWQPEVIAIPDPRDLHRDHCTAGLFALMAIGEVTKQVPAFRPHVFGYLVHSPDYPGEPRWRENVSRQGVCGERTGVTLLGKTEWLRVELNDSEQRGKARALQRYTTQMQVMRGFLEHFVRPEEWFSRLQEEQWRLPTLMTDAGVRAAPCKVVL
ncbi:MAG: PIG-L family deacetylase [Candidatus Binatia bacterium]|nr:PIG-L family deacetylase [Candidatus Binatia bacterium]